MVLVPPLPFSPPPRFTRVPCPLQFARFLSLFLFPFASSPSVSVSRPPPPSASEHPSSVRRTPPADSSGGLLTKCPLLDSSAPYAGLFPTCTADVTWLGCGLRGVGDGATRNSPWVPRRVDRRCLANVFFWDSGFILVSGFLPSIFKTDGFCRHSCYLVEFFVVPVSLCPPPPSPFPRTTVRVPLPSLLDSQLLT